MKPDTTSLPAVVAGTPNAPTVTAGAIVHAEPVKGGSYIRNTSTGELQEQVRPASTQRTQE